MERIRLFRDAWGLESPWVFIGVVSLIGALGSGALAFIVDRADRNRSVKETTQASMRHVEVPPATDVPLPTATQPPEVDREAVPCEESGCGGYCHQKPIRSERWAAGRFLGGLLAFYALCLIAYRGDFTTKRSQLVNYGLISLIGAFALFCGFLNYLI